MIGDNEKGGGRCRSSASIFETYYDKQYTLKKLTTESYIRSPQFEAHGCAIKWLPNTAAQWYGADELPALFARIDWQHTGLIAHHAHFDGLILSHHFGCRPAYWFCTLSMARLLVGNHLSLSLDELAKGFGLGAKSAGYLVQGKHWREMNAWEQSALAEGCKHDVELTWRLFGLLQRSFPAEEYDVVDMTVRMFTEPRLHGDLKLLETIWYEEEERRRARVDELGLDGADLRSNEKFAALLESWGVEVEYKDGKHGPIPAVAKNDPFLQSLLADEDPDIADLAAARIDSKSTAIQRRCEAIGAMAGRGALCVYLVYCGAHTTRWSGGDKTNFQNLRRGHSIRQSLVAPAQYLLAVPDQSQIECRLLNFLAGQTDVVERFRHGHDPYTGIASQFYGRDITKSDQLERGTGKQAELSCGYGCGAGKFQRTARLGIYGPPVTLDLNAAQRFVNLYRHTHAAVTRYWRAGEDIIRQLAARAAGTWGPLSYRDGYLYLPNGAPLIYTQLDWKQDNAGSFGWQRKTRNGWDKLYGAKLVEQTTQALARVTCSQAMSRIRRAGFSVVGTSHDEAWVLVPHDHATEAAEFIRQEMKRVPEWLPGIPLDAEIVVGERYSK